MSKKRDEMCAMIGEITALTGTVEINGRQHTWRWVQSWVEVNQTSNAGGQVIHDDLAEVVSDVVSDA